MDKRICFELAREIDVLVRNKRIALAKADSIVSLEVDPLKEYSSYSLGELWEMLPEKIIINGVEYDLDMDKTGKFESKNVIGYVKNDMSEYLIKYGSGSAADAAGRLFIWCINERFVK